MNISLHLSVKLKIEPCDTELAINLSGNETGGSYTQLRGQCSKQSLK
jgi:hypothetical protein